MGQRLIISTNLVVSIFVIRSNPNYLNCFLILVRFFSNLRDRVTQKQMMCRAITQSLMQTQNYYLTVWSRFGVIIIVILFDFSISSFGFMIFN